MKLRILYFARLREALGVSAEEPELPVQVATVDALIGWLRARGGVWAVELAEGRAFRVAVNQEMAAPDTPLAAGDEVALFPPVTGG
ncbi:MAG: molybdopterin converting factor subunit 1 [Thiobacillaceae bacterium]|nr:molybdopterin converting factor subunit 1 [Thiobacillaceae bacterium]